MTSTDDSFPLLIWSGLFKAKHWKKMGNAIWLFGMLIDKVTKEENGNGYVLGGTPVTYKTFEKELPITRRQYLRYLDILRDGDYIHTRNTHHGLTIVIHKSKKFHRKSDKKVTGAETNLSSGGDKNVTGAVTDTSPSNIDTTEDTKKTKSGDEEFQEVWVIMHKAFKLPKSASGSYKSDITATIQRLGMAITVKACGEFLKRTEDHPPDGRVKSMSSFFHWKKIDEYVAMIMPEKKSRFYACLGCIEQVNVVKVEEHDRIDEQMQMPVNFCEDHPSPRYDVTRTVLECKDKDMSRDQIGTVLKVLIKKVNEDRNNENSGN